MSFGFHIPTQLCSFEARSQNCENQLLASLFLSVHPSAWNNSAPTGRIFMKFDVWVFFGKLSRKLKYRLNPTGIRYFTCLNTSRSVLLRMRIVSGRGCREYENTHFMFNDFFSENRTVYETMWKNIVKPVGHKCPYGSCALHAGYLQLKTHTQNM